MQRPRQNRRLLIGVTGSFGTGKSTVARLLADSSCRIIDADKIAHQLLRRDAPLYREVLKKLGRQILNKDSRIDRRKLAEEVFSNPALLRWLNRTAHPLIVKEIMRQANDSQASWIIVDAPLLIESGLYRKMDVVIVVKARKGVQLKRLQRKYSLDKAQLQKRIICQMPLKEKVAYADFVIDNSGSLAQTKRKVNRIKRRLLKWRSLT